MNEKHFGLMARLLRFNLRVPRRPEDIAFRRVGSYRSVRERLAAVAAVFQMPESGIDERRRNSAARGAAAWALVRHAG